VGKLSTPLTETSKPSALGMFPAKPETNDADNAEEMKRAA